MIQAFDLRTGNNEDLWTVEVDVKPIPTTEAAAASFTAAGLAKSTALAIRDKLREKHSRRSPFKDGELLAASWVWSPADETPRAPFAARQGLAVLSMVVRVGPGTFLAYLAVPK